MLRKKTIEHLHYRTVSIYCSLVVLSLLFLPGLLAAQSEPSGEPGRNTSRAVRILKGVDRCLDVEGFSFEPGASLIHFPCRDTDNENQLWRFRYLGGGWYQIVAEHSGLCLAVENGSLEPDARVVQQVCKPNDNDDQLWSLDPVYFDAPDLGIIYNIRSRHSGMCLAEDFEDFYLRQTVCGEPTDFEQGFFFEMHESRFLPTGASLFLGQGRFRVSVTWTDRQGESGIGRVVPFGADDSGMFWFFNANNWEMLIKVLDACGFNDRYWVFLAATTDVAFTVRVEDTKTGTVWRHDNALGQAADAVTDTAAFATCP